jgi:hypothetical protein
MPEITNHGKLFFSIKTIGGWSLTGAMGSAHTRMMRPSQFQSSGK